MENEKITKTQVHRIAKVLETLLDMIMGLKNIAQKHEERMDALAEAGRAQAMGGLSTLEAMRGMVDALEDLEDDNSCLKNEVNNLLVREEALNDEVATLKRELGDLRALVLKQHQIDLDQGGLHFKSWYEERDRLRATVKNQAGLGSGLGDEPKGQGSQTCGQKPGQRGRDDASSCQGIQI